MFIHDKKNFQRNKKRRELPQDNKEHLQKHLELTKYVMAKD